MSEHSCGIVELTVNSGSLQIMLCVSFNLPEGVAFVPTSELGILKESDTSSLKRPRTE